MKLSCAQAKMCFRR